MYIFAFIHTNVHVGTFSSCTCGHISQLYPLWRPSSNPVAMSEWVSESHSVMLYSLWPHGLYSPWNSPGQNAGVGSCSLLQGIFPTQGSNPGLCIARGFFTVWATREAPQAPGRIGISILILQIKTLRLRQIKWFSQSYSNRDYV